MKFSTTIILFAASALALPTSEDSQVKRAASPYCAPGLFTQAQCCSTDVAGVANLDCATRKSDHYHSESQQMNRGSYVMNSIQDSYECL